MDSFSDYLLSRTVESVDFCQLGSHYYNPDSTANCLDSEKASYDFGENHYPDLKSLQPSTLVLIVPATPETSLAAIEVTKANTGGTVHTCFESTSSFSSPQSHLQNCTLKCL